MPKIKPLDKLVTKARNLRDHHRERHAPSGFAFALADSIDYLDQAHWQKVTPAGSLFFSPRYLRVLEEAGPEICGSVMPSSSVRKNRSLRLMLRA